MTTPQEVRDACDSRTPLGNTIRIQHTSCSEGKDPCLVIKRVHDGWVYKCHRCGIKGGLGLDTKTPKELIDYVKSFSPELEGQAKFKPYYLPRDSILLSGPNVESGLIPLNAAHQLLRYRLVSKDFMYLDIHYSRWYNRLIFPVRNTELVNPSYLNYKILGWVGRHVVEHGETVAKQYSTPKWLIRREVPGNVYYHFSKYHPENENLVVVEDIISAYRIFRATNTATLALLGTNMSVPLLLRIRKELGESGRMILWLDSDAIDKSVAYWKKAISMSIPTSYVRTESDPKIYSDESIRHELR